MTDNAVTYNTADARPTSLLGNIRGPRRTVLIGGVFASLVVGYLFMGLATAATGAATFLLGLVVVGLLIAPDPRRSPDLAAFVGKLTRGRVTPEPRQGYVIDNLLIDGNWLRDKALRRTRYEGKDDIGYTFDGAAIDRQPPSSIGGLRWLTFEWKGHTVCMPVDDDDTVTLAVETESASDGLMDPDQMDEHRANVASAYVNLANRPGHTDRVAQLTITRPLNEPGTILHDTLPDDVDPWQRASYRDAEDEMAREGEAYAHYWTIRIPATPQRAKAVRIAGGGDDGLAVVVARELDALDGALASAGYTVLGPLNVAATAMLLRGSYDRDYPPIPHDSEATFLPRDAWPTTAGYNETVDYVEADGWLTAVAEVRLPDGQVHANFLAPLLVGVEGVHRSMAWVLDLIPRALALGAADDAQALTEGNAEFRAERSRTWTYRSRSNEAAVHQLAADVSNGHTKARGVCYISTAARNADSLETAKDNLQVKASESGVELHWLRKRHGRAIPNLAVFARGLS